MPDPSQIPVTLPKDIKCTGTEGVQQMCYLYGDPDKPGPVYRDVQVVARPFLQAALSQQ